MAPGLAACMASALLHTHERQSNPYSLGSDDMMKKGPKMAKLGGADVANDLRVLKRKSMSLNHDYVQGGTPVAVTVDLAKLSREQRSELRKKLKRGMEEMRTVVTKVDTWLDVLHKGKQEPAALKSESKLHTHSSEAKSLRADGNGQGRKEVASVVSDPASSSGETPRDMPKEMSQREARLARQPSVLVPEASAGTPSEKAKRTPKANPVYQNDFVSGKDKMPPPEKPKPKKMLSGRGENKDPRRQKVEAARAKRMADMLKQCTTLLRKLMSHKHGWVFNDPVDAEKLGLHDYHQIIQKPMDLGTIKKKLHLKHYPSPVEFSDDIRLTFSNAMTYNPVGHDVYVMAELLKNIFEDWWKNMTKKLDDEKKRADREEEMLANDDDSFEDATDLKRGERDLHSLTRGKSSSRMASQPKPRPDEIGKRPMTFEEKRKLSVNLERLPGEKLERIVQIIKKRNPDLGQNEDEIEVDIDSFDNDTLWELDRFVTNYMKSRGKKAKSKTQTHRSDFQVCMSCHPLEFDLHLLMGVFKRSFRMCCSPQSERFKIIIACQRVYYFRKCTAYILCRSFD